MSCTFIVVVPDRSSLLLSRNNGLVGVLEFGQARARTDTSPCHSLCSACWVLWDVDGGAAQDFWVSAPSARAFGVIPEDRRG